MRNGIRARSEVEFTHGICPDCLEKGILAIKEKELPPHLS